MDWDDFNIFVIEMFTELMNKKDTEILNLIE